MRRRLDDVCRIYTKLRDQDTCQTCGIHKDATQLGSLDWSHYISRRHTIVRWNQMNTISQCRHCHMEYGDGINGPLINAINRIWGDGTTNLLEQIAVANKTIKGTQLDLVDFRLELETFYKELIQNLNDGCTPRECMDSTFTFDRWGNNNNNHKECNNE